MKSIAPICFLTLSIALSGCATTNLETYNRGMYKANKTLDKYTLKPLTKAYQTVTPDRVERSVSHFFNNIGEINTTVNSLLQGNLRNAGLSSSRFVWNTTLGLGGLFDVATPMKITAHKEDLGQTLRVWGVPEGPYLVLPFFGPSTTTDTMGIIGNYTFDPLFHYHWNNNYQRQGFTLLGLVNKRAQLMPFEKIAQSASTDEYTFVKNAYLQRRKALVRNGKADTSVDEEFDALFEEDN